MTNAQTNAVLTVRVDVSAPLNYIYVLRAGVTLLVLNILDLALTYGALRLGATEGNPLAVWLIHSYLAIPVKLGICLLAIELARRFPDKCTMRSVCASWAAVGVYSLVVVLNMVTILRYAFGGAA